MITTEELLALANDLSLSTSEASWRASISRAYYAVYLSAVRLPDIPDLEEDISERIGLHKQLRKALQSSEDKRYKTLSRYLQSLHKLRIEADYSLSGDIQKRTVLTHLNECALAHTKVCDILSS